MTIGRPPLPLERFFDYISPEPNSGCWLWTGAVVSRGYGRFGKRPCHRYSWELHRGPIPPGMFVCHKCDVPGCVNPDHLFIGTLQDNTADKVAKRRQARGEIIGSSKLTEDDVRAIRADQRSLTAVAAAYGVDRSNVAMIRRRKSWGHLPDAVDDQPLAYWSAGHKRARLLRWSPEWQEIGLTLDDARRLRAGLDHAIAQAEAEEAEP